MNQPKMLWLLHRSYAKQSEEFPQGNYACTPGPALAHGAQQVAMLDRPREGRHGMNCVWTFRRAGAFAGHEPLKRWPRLARRGCRPHPVSHGPQERHDVPETEVAGGRLHREQGRERSLARRTAPDDEHVPISDEQIEEVLADRHPGGRHPHVRAERVPCETKQQTRFDPLVLRPHGLSLCEMHRQQPFVVRGSVTAESGQLRVEHRRMKHRGNVSQQSFPGTSGGDRVSSVALAQLSQEFYFGFRRCPPTALRWREDLRARLPLTLRERGEFVYGTEPVGRYRLVEVAEVTALFPETRAWQEPHPCSPLGAVIGCLALAFRSYWPWQRRAQVAEHVCRELRGPVACVEKQRCIDPVQLREVTLEQATSKYGFADSGMLFEDPAYCAHVERELGRVARLSGASVHQIATSHNPFRTLDQGARGSGSRAVLVWVYDASMLKGAEADLFFADLAAR